jgi:hypothetical protein
MPKKTIPNFPEEDQNGPWPLLKPTTVDVSYVATSKPRRVQQLPVQTLSQTHPSAGLSESRFLSLISPIPKGIILGLFIFGLIYSFLPLKTFWISSLHWLYPLAGIALLTLLIGPDIAFAILIAISLATALLLNWHMIVTSPLVLLSFVAGGILVLYIRRLFPKKKP